jgi:acetyl esterase/lipase
MNKPEFISFVTEDNIKLNLNLHRAKNNRKNITILYFHGGGLLYGVRDDLPEIYINQFLNSGYDFLALDYPLAPESKLDMILKSACEILFFYLKNLDKVFALENNRYVLFGRSAGAYLCFMLCDRLIKTEALMPMAIISLYGYARLDEVQFNTPNNYYNKLASVPDKSIEKIISDSPVTYGPMNLRFALYIKARQEGTWIKHLCGKEYPTKYSLDDEKLKEFPPTILAAATLDPDVPYKVTKTLSKLIPNSYLITIYKEAHDFDRDVNDESGKATYEEIMQWLENTIDMIN